MYRICSNIQRSTTIEKMFFFLFLLLFHIHIYLETSNFETVAGATKRTVEWITILILLFFAQMNHRMTMFHLWVFLFFCFWQRKMIFSRHIKMIKINNWTDESSFLCLVSFVFSKIDSIIWNGMYRFCIQC